MGNPLGIPGCVAIMKTCSEGFDQVGKAADRFRSRLEEELRRREKALD